MATSQPSGAVHHLRRATLLRDSAALTDGQLLEAFVTCRDEAAFEALVRRHGPMVLGVCRRLLGSPQDAEDAFQATFLVLLRKAASIACRDLLANWLYGVAHRTALEARGTLAQRRVREQQVRALPEPEARPEADPRPELRLLLDQEVGRLPDKYRQAVLLCDLAGRTRAAVARQLGIPVGTLSGRLTTARRLLADRLARRGLSGAGAALAAVLSGEAASAAVPASLIHATARALPQAAASGAAAPLASTRVLVLTEGVLKKMFLGKLKVTAALAAAAAFVVMCLLTVCAATSPPQPPPEKKPQPAPARVLPAKVSGFRDSGTFHLYKDEEALVRITFTWKDDGSFENNSVLEFAGQKVSMRTTITPDKEGYWTRIEGSSRIGPFHLGRAADKVKQTLGKKTESFALKAGAVLFDDFAPALMSQWLRSYDAKKGGKQTLPAVIIPGALLDATIERKDTVERSVAGKDLKLTRYLLTLATVDITVWADAAGKVYLADVPSQSAAFVREGYEALRKAERVEPLLSRPEFAVKAESNVRVAMRDGVKLATDVYRPDAPGKHPGILIRTPYKKEMSELTGKYYARRGFAVAIQDCRGRFASEGVWVPFVHEGKDGYDSVEWLAGQPWCSGKVGMIGGSYLGWVQWWAAAERPPHLVTIIPNVSPPDPFYNIPYEYGAFFLMGAIWWAEVLETQATADISGEKIIGMLKKPRDAKYQELLRRLPVIDLDKAILGKENPSWRKWIEHPSEDAYWQKINFLSRLERVRLPVFHQSGWFDGDGIGSKLNYARMSALGHPHQKLILGPWGHTDTATRMQGGHDFGPQALRDLPRDYLRWFDYWLKGIDNGVLKEPLVSIFVMNSNRWLHGPKYPLPQTRFEKWYLAGGGKANTSLGDGKLVREPPGKDAPPDRYRYDPADPTPNPDLLGGLEKETAEADKGKKPADRDRREERTRKRRDLLVYVSEPLAEPYTFAGPVSAVLYAASSARDTDWFMRLMTVDPKGKVFVLGEGKIRARFRRSMAKPELLEPGKVYEYALDLWQTGITVPKGHRLRVEVASASFPVFSRNLNTGGHNEKETRFVTAEQTVYHDAQYPSHVLLPMIPEQASEKKSP
jgi:putative CocE/NonD family hydrolase